jgi:hypothetical protein
MPSVKPTNQDCCERSVTATDNRLVLRTDHDTINPDTSFLFEHVVDTSVGAITAFPVVNTTEEAASGKMLSFPTNHFTFAVPSCDRSALAAVSCCVHVMIVFPPD